MYINYECGGQFYLKNIMQSVEIEGVNYHMTTDTDKGCHTVYKVVHGFLKGTKVQQNWKIEPF